MSEVSRCGLGDFCLYVRLGVEQVFASLLVKLLSDFSKFFQRKQRQLVRVDPFLTRAFDLLQQQFDLMFQLSDAALLFFQGNRKSLDLSGVLLMSLARSSF